MKVDDRNKSWPSYWNPEDETFWTREGRGIANRNLWISIPNLLLAFAVWIYWGHGGQVRPTAAFRLRW